MDQEKREFHKEEFVKLDALRLDHAKLTAKVDYVEHELRATKSDAANRFERLENKIDDLHNRFDAVSSEVKSLATKIAVAAVGVGILLQVILKHLGFI